MNAVKNLRFEPPIGFQTSGGPGWSTEVISLSSGREVRNAVRATSLRRWQIAGVPATQADVSGIVRFFNARGGRHEGFRFRDPFGWTSATGEEAVSPLDQLLGMGDGENTEFQLVLDEGAVVKRVITRPVATSVRIAVDGVETSAFTLNDQTGRIMFDIAPSVGAALTAGFEYDLPVRFDSDTLDLSAPVYGAFQLVQLALTEIQEG